MNKRRVLIVILLLILAGVLYLFGWNFLPKEQCNVIKTQLQCELTSDCYWEEEFEHDGVGPTGEYYCEDRR